MSERERGGGGREGWERDREGYREIETDRDTGIDKYKEGRRAWETEIEERETDTSKCMCHI